MIATDDVGTSRLGRWAGKLAWFGIFHPRTTLGLTALATAAAICFGRADCLYPPGRSLRTFAFCGALAAAAGVVRRRVGVGLVGAVVGVASVGLADALLERGYLQFSTLHVCLSGAPFDLLSMAAAPIAVVAAAAIDAAVAARVAAGRDLLTAWREGAADAAPRLAAGALAVVATILFVGTVENAPVLTPAAASWFLLAAALNGAILASLVAALSAWDALGARRRRFAAVAAPAAAVGLAPQPAAPPCARGLRVAASIGALCGLLAALGSVLRGESFFLGGALFGVALATLGLRAFGAAATQAAAGFVAGMASVLSIWGVAWISAAFAASPRGFDGRQVLLPSMAAVFVAFAARRRAGASVAAPLVASAAVVAAAILGAAGVDREACAIALLALSPLIGFGASRFAGSFAERLSKKPRGGSAAPAGGRPE